jgi:predicted DNA-binding transcriptional regulator YafY
MTGCQAVADNQPPGGGETLSVHKLAAEFGVSVRTLRRDFRERLMYLDLEYQSGYCRLRTAGSEMQMVPDVLIFAHRSGLAGLFPGLDRRLVNALLMCDEAPCVIPPASPASSPSEQLSFWRLVQAITDRRKVTLLADGQRCERLAPCRLLIHQQTWYLIAEHNGHIAVFTLDEIHLVQPLQESFDATTVYAVWLKTRCLFRPYPIFDLFSSHFLHLFRLITGRNSAAFYPPGSEEEPDAVIAIIVKNRTIPTPYPDTSH